MNAGSSAKATSGIRYSWYVRRWKEKVRHASSNNTFRGWYTQDGHLILMVGTTILKAAVEKAQTLRQAERFSTNFANQGAAMPGTQPPGARGICA
jgi:hypothetical protein